VEDETMEHQGTANGKALKYSVLGAVLLCGAILTGCTAQQPGTSDVATTSSPTPETPFVLTTWESSPLQDESLLGKAQWNQDGTRVTLSAAVDGCGAYLGQLSVRDSTHLFVDYLPSLTEVCASSISLMTYSAKVPSKVSRSEVIYVEFGEGIGFDGPLEMQSLTDMWAAQT
jgi:hypothetical protein